MKAYRQLLIVFRTSRGIDLIGTGRPGGGSVRNLVASPLPVKRPLADHESSV
jgi:hypothetical protein